MDAHRRNETILGIESEPTARIEGLMERESVMEWYEFRVNVTRLGRWLKDDRGFTADELQGYYEEPWKWTLEWELMLKEKGS